MTIKQYLVFSVAVFIAVIIGVVYIGQPVAPFAVILLAAQTMIAFELEDHKVVKVIAEVCKGLHQKTSLRPN